MSLFGFHPLFETRVKNGFLDILREFQLLRKDLFKMSEAAKKDLQDATTALLSEVNNIKSQNASIVAFVEGIPALVAAAVAKALADAQETGDIDDDTAEAIAASINGAVTDLTASAQDVVDAVNANTPAPPADTTPPATDPTTPVVDDSGTTTPDAA